MNLIEQFIFESQSKDKVVKKTSKKKKVIEDIDYDKESEDLYRRLPVRVQNTLDDIWGGNPNSKVKVFNRDTFAIYLAGLLDSGIINDHEAEILTFMNNDAFAESISRKKVSEAYSDNRSLYLGDVHVDEIIDILDRYLDNSHRRTKEEEAALREDILELERALVRYAQPDRISD